MGINTSRSFRNQEPSILLLQFCTHNTGFAISLEHSQSGGVFNTLIKSGLPRETSSISKSCQWQRPQFLATRSDRVIHIARVRSEKFKVQEDNWSLFLSSIRSARFLHHIYTTVCRIVLDRDLALLLARSDISQGESSTYRLTGTNPWYKIL